MGGVISKFVKYYNDYTVFCVILCLIVKITPQIINYYCNEKISALCVSIDFLFRV